MLEYRGYRAGPIRFDPEEKTFSATVAGLEKDVIDFEGTTAEELMRSFQGSVDGYLKFCGERGQEPDHAISSSYPRVGPGEFADLAHRFAAALADFGEEEFAAAIEDLRRKCHSMRS